MPLKRRICLNCNVAWVASGLGKMCPGCGDQLWTVAQYAKLIGLPTETLIKRLLRYRELSRATLRFSGGRRAGRRT